MSWSRKGQVESIQHELFWTDLDQIGLDEPFTNQLRESERDWLLLPDGYLTEGEPEDRS